MRLLWCKKTGNGWEAFRNQIGHCLAEYFKKSFRFTFLTLTVKNRIILFVRSLEKILLSLSVLAVYQNNCLDLRNTDVDASPESWYFSIGIWPLYL